MKDKKEKFVPDWEQLQKDNPTRFMTVNLENLVEFAKDGKMCLEDGTRLMFHPDYGRDVKI